MAVFFGPKDGVFISGPLINIIHEQHPFRKNPGRKCSVEIPICCASGCKWAPEGGEIGLLSLGSEARANRAAMGFYNSMNDSLSGPKKAEKIAENGIVSWL